MVNRFLGRFRAAWRVLTGKEVVEQVKKEVAPMPPVPPTPPVLPAPPEDPGIPEENIPHVTGIPGGRIISTKNPDEVRRVIAEAAAEGRRVSLNVRDKDGWHQLYTNKRQHPGRRKMEPGMTASELEKRIDADGVPGERESEELKKWREGRKEKEQ